MYEESYTRRLRRVNEALLLPIGCQVTECAHVSSQTDCIEQNESERVVRKDGECTRHQCCY